ncbi:paxillin isoform X3 [Drosophila mojavensis]|uniref:Uncharacterized protein, isoform E n=1 Tax=Drosophila mojavensis TaxID=7230 RepID=A0A0Q9X430_DROMO|nr:paxillin isoform X3 [Drosophila mojavensis]KRG02790.1 uncharacterized protein Dmoj_GI17221, isoform E [Drosophila mojavensis]
MSSKLISSSFHSSPLNDCFKVGVFERRLDALLADLQNSVPGQQTQPQYGIVQSKQQQQQQHFVDNTPGYGSLRGKAQQSQPQVYQEHYSVETRSPTAAEFNGSGQQSNGYQHQGTGSLPRSGYSNGQNSSGLSELDSLLQDLQNARYNNGGVERKEVEVPVNYSTPVSKYNTFNSYASVEDRPSVDSLLNELDNAHIYAVPNGSAHKSPTPGRHVTITVRETKTEKLTGPDGPVGTIEEQIVQKKDSYSPNLVAPAPAVKHQGYTSQATKELDDLMASLSDFKDCRQPFQGGSFFDHEGLPYCETHYHAKRGSLCAGCSKPITGRCITAMFKKFHPEHFVCAFCLKQLNKGTFKEQKDKPYCHACFDKIFG